VLYHPSSYRVQFDVSVTTKKIVLFAYET
jgi:hypothetical protein